MMARGRTAAAGGRQLDHRVGQDPAPGRDRGAVVEQDRQVAGRTGVGLGAGPGPGRPGDRHQRPRQDPERVPRAVAALGRQPDHLAAVELEVQRQLGEQARLADAELAGDDHRGAVTGLGLGPRRRALGQLAIASDHGGQADRAVGRARARAAAGGDVGIAQPSAIPRQRSRTSSAVAGRAPGAGSRSASISSARATGSSGRSLRGSPGWPARCAATTARGVAPPNGARPEDDLPQDDARTSTDRARGSRRPAQASGAA
jgi:hypothetical protein